MPETQLYLTHTDAGLELTREEFAEADFEKPWRYERANGRLVVMAPAGHDHHASVEPCRDHLVVYKVGHPEIVRHVFEESWTTVDEQTDRLPDIAVYLTTGAGRIPDRVPELIFESVSRGSENRNRDYTGKREEYERLGVREYVIIDRFEHKVTVLRLTAGRYEQTVLGPDDVYETPLLPGLEIPLTSII